MRTRSIGETTVSAVGAGDVSLAIAASRGVDHREVERALTSALAMGLSLVDVHPEVDAERLAGEVVRSQRARDHAILTTHVERLAGREGPIEQMPPGYLQERVEAALRSTRLDALPLVLLELRPTWTTSRAWPELVGTAARLVREGKVLAYGASLSDEDAALPLEDHGKLLAEHWLVALSVAFNACTRTALPLIEAATAAVTYGPEAPPPAPGRAPMVVSMFDLIAETKVSPSRPIRRTVPLAILARQPLAGGALAGHLGPGAKLSPRDDRELDPEALERIAVRVARLAALVRTTPPAARASKAARETLEATKRPEQMVAFTLAELALRYVVDRGAIALPRLHRNETIPEALLACAGDPLPPEITAVLEEKL